MTTTLQIVNNKGSLNFNYDGSYECISTNYTINSNNGSYLNEIGGNIIEQSHSGNIALISDIGTITLTSNAALSNAIIFQAINNAGGIMNIAGSGGYDVLTSNGNINLLSMGADINIGVSSNGTPALNQTQNVNIESFNTLNMSSGDMYFVSSDVISFVSNTGDIQFGANGAPVITFKDGNVLINQNNSNLDYQVDIAVTHDSNNNTGYNGLVINTFESNVASDLTLQTSNTLGDGTQCIMSLGSFADNNPYATFQSYLAYQSNNTVILLDNNEFQPTDIGRTIYWTQSNRQNTITNLGTYITSSSDTANVTVSGTYTGTTSRIYLLQIDTPSTFKWSNDGGTTFQQQFIPITLNLTTLEAGLQIQFTQTSGFTTKQQFTFQTKITAIVTDTITPDTTPETIHTLQPFYSYIKTTTPSDIVISTNNSEKMRITGDGSIGIQKEIPTACLDINSNYNKIILVNQSITGYQINPSSSHLNAGGYVTVWNSQDLPPTQLNFDIYAQRYLADGSRHNNNFKINNITAANQSYPSVAGHRQFNSNHYICVWSNYNTGLGLNKIYCQIFHNDTPIRTYDIPLDTTNNTTSNQIFPKVAGLYNGNYVIIWNADDLATGIYSVKGLIINDNGTIINNKFNISNPSSLTSANYAYVAALPSDDTYNPNGFVVGYMTAIDTTPDPRYTITIRIMNSNGTAYSSEIPITAVGNDAISSISDGLLSISEINLRQVNATYGNGGFILTFYRSYQADTSLYNIGDPISGLTSGATASITFLDGPNKVITLQNVANRFLVDEEISITSSIPNVGTIIEKINAIDFLTLNTANVTLDTGNKNVVAYRFNSNVTQTSDAIWNIQINSSPLFTDLDRESGNSAIFEYKNPMSAVSIDNNGIACFSWTSGNIPNIYYQLINIASGGMINEEVQLITQYSGLKQRNQVVTHLQSIEGNDYGFVISWDNQSLDLMDTGIYQQLIGYKHALLSLEDGTSNFIFNHNSQCGIGTNNPECNLHIKNVQAKMTQMILENTNNHVITSRDLHNITFKNGNGDVLNYIKSGNTSRYNDLYPLPENLIGFYKFDETEGTQAKDSSGASSFLQSTSPVYINTSAILQNFDISSCWVSGLINNALLFNGVDNYLFIENTAPNHINTVLEDTNNMTISTWINIPSNITNGSRYSIISNGSNTSISGTYSLDLWDNANNGNMKPVLSMTVMNGLSVNTISLVGTTIINDDAWHHILVTVTLSGGNVTITLYIDGSENNTVTTTGSISSVQHGTYNTYIGTREGSTRFYRGYLDELRIYDNVLNNDMITTLYKYGNPLVASKSMLNISELVINDGGNLNNLGACPLPYSILTGELIAFSSNTTVFGINTLFTSELTVGDIITLDIAQNIEYVVITITSDVLLTLDTRGYDGPEDSKPYQSVLRRPSIFTFFDNGDNILGNIDNYGNLIIGNGKAASMLEIVGETGNTKHIPAITLTNNSVENGLYSRKTAINFRGYNTDDVLLAPSNLGHIETSHYGTNTDNKGIMRFFINDGNQENNVMSLTSNGYVGIGGQNNPLEMIHVTTSNECSMILQSNNNASNSGSSIFDERSNLYFAGLTSITETLATQTTKKVLSAISGSNDSNSKILNGRLDLSTNNDDNSVKNGIESRLSITHTGNVGVNILNPPAVFTVAPELRISNGSLNTIANVSYSVGVSTVTIDNNIFPSSTEERTLLIGGTYIINNATLQRGSILSIIANNQMTVSGDLTAWIGYGIYIHHSGLNVSKSGYVGINTNNIVSPLVVNGAITMSINTTSSNITLSAIHHTIICNTSSNNITVTLPANTTNMIGRMYRIKNASTSGNIVSVDGNGSLIDGSATYNILYSGGVMGYNTVQSDGTNWWIV